MTMYTEEQIADEIKDIKERYDSAKKGMNKINTLMATIVAMSPSLLNMLPDTPSMDNPTDEQLRVTAIRSLNYKERQAYNAIVDAKKLAKKQAKLAKAS